MPAQLSCDCGHTWTSDEPTAVEGRSVIVPRCPRCGRVLVAQLAATLPPGISLGGGAANVATVAQGVTPNGTAGQQPSVLDLPVIQGHQILGELGRGGMGVVYLAQQVNLNRLVALKMILGGGHVSKRGLERFRKEAEAVARLRHPNIVQIYFVGEENGLPFFSLEFVDGSCLADRLDDGPMPPRAAAAMVSKLARAIHFAHQHRIVHRDLKPGNILLTPDGEPKITDFGLAKSLDEGRGETKTGEILGTPAYMAPEQAQGKIKEIGPEADIYALGAILYELLTGRPPFEAESPMDTLLMAAFEEPIPPKRLRPTIPRDLEIVCLKCLEKEPRRRYATAEALAADLGHFLAGEPIAARPGGTWERLAKWARRRPDQAALIAVSVVSAVLLFAGSVVYGVQVTKAHALAEQKRREAEVAESLARDALTKEQVASHKEKEARTEAVSQKNLAEAQRRVAEQNFALAQQAVDEMLTQLGQDHLRHVPEMEGTRRRLLEQALRIYDQLARQRGDDPTIRFATAKARRRIGEIRALLDDHDMAESAFAEAVELLCALVKRTPDHMDFALELSEVYLDRGKLYRDAGKFSQAEEDFIRACNQLSPWCEEERPAAKPRLLLSRILNELAFLAGRENQTDPSRKAYGEALALQRALVAEHPGNKEYREYLAGTLNDRGLFYAEIGAAHLAEPDLAEAIHLMEDLVQGDQKNTDFRVKMAAAYDNLGLVRRDQAIKVKTPDVRRKAVNDALATVAKGLTIRQRLYDNFPTVPRFQYGVALSRLNHASVRFFLPPPLDFDALLDDLDQARDLLIHLVHHHDDAPDYKHALGMVLDTSALVLANKGEFLEAGKRLTQALEQQRLALQVAPRNRRYLGQLRKHDLAVSAILTKWVERPTLTKEQVAWAVKTADELTHPFCGEAEEHFHAAIQLAKLSAAAGRNKRLGKDAATLADDFARRSVEMLTAAIDQDLSFDRLNDDAFDPVRHRDDFQKLRDRQRR